MASANVFDAIQPILVKAIPKVIRSLKHGSPFCIFRIYYYDTHAPCTYLDFRCVTVETRQKILDDDGRDALFSIWSSEEKCGARPKIIIPGDPPSTASDKRISKLFASIYELLCDDEDEYMPAFRSALQSVSRRLNTLDWSTICQVSDDFVVVPADGSQHFCDEYDDLVNSIPPERLKLLRQRGLLGAGDEWDQRPGFDDGDASAVVKTVEEIEARAKAMPVRERVAYLIGQLDKMAAGEECEMTRIGVNAHFPLDLMHQIGEQAAVPLLNLACKWADTPEWDVDDEETAVETPMASVLLILLRKIQELKRADWEVELLLRDFLKKSCRVNAGRSLWGTLPFHCAKCLHALFDKYPKPEMARNNALVEPERFLAVPAE